MSLFRSNYNKPGPGVPKDAPRKKGPARFFEVLARDFSNLLKLNLLLFLCSLPAQVAYAVALLFLAATGQVSLWFYLFLALGAVLSFPVGPALTAAAGLVVHMLRDDPGFLWHDFKKLFRENFRSTLLPGVLAALLAVLEVAVVMLQPVLSGGVSPVLAGALFLSVLLLAMCTPFYFLQSAFLELGAFGKLKNSILLALGNLPRSAGGAVFGTGITVALYFLLPGSFPVLVLVGYTVPLLIQMMFVWPVVDKVFHIDKTLQARARAEAAEADLTAEEGGARGG